MWLIKLVFPQICKSDMSKYRYLEVFQRVPWNWTLRESTVVEERSSCVEGVGVKLALFKKKDKYHKEVKSPNTPQPLYNTIVGVHSINRAS